MSSGALADTWRDPAAWTGMTRAGGVDLPGATAGAVLADELVVHGWDLARATAQEYAPDPAALRAAYGFLRAAAGDGLARGRGVVGPVVPVPEDARPLDRALGLSGRDPRWSPRLPRPAPRAGPPTRPRSPPGAVFRQRAPAARRKPLPGAPVGNLHPHLRQKH